MKELSAEFVAFGIIALIFWGFSYILNKNEKDAEDKINNELKNLNGYLKLLKSGDQTKRISGIINLSKKIERDEYGDIFVNSVGGFGNFEDKINNATRKQDLRGARLTGIKLNNIDLSDSNLSGSDLSNSILVYCSLNSVNLSNANLTNIRLTFSDLSGADFKNANLVDSYLVGANLKNTNLIGADLKNAKLQDTNFSNSSVKVNDLDSEFSLLYDYKDSELKDTNFEGASYNSGTIFPKKFNPTMAGMIKKELE